MTTAHQTYETSVTAAATTVVGAKSTAQSNFASAVAAVGSDVGTRPGFPTGNATYVAGIAAAGQARLAALATAEQAKQSAIMAARDTLRAANVADGSAR